MDQGPKYKAKATKQVEVKKISAQLWRRQTFLGEDTETIDY